MLLGPDVQAPSVVSDNSTAFQAVVGLLRDSPRDATARIASPGFEELVCAQASPRVLRMLDHVASRLERRGDAAGARSLGVIRDLASPERGQSPTAQRGHGTSAAERGPESPKEGYTVYASTPRSDGDAMHDQDSAVANARGYYRLLYKEVRAGRDHSDEVDGDIATGRAMDRVLGMLRSEEGRWASIASRLDFVYLLCSQASPQLLSMLEHSYRRTMRARHVADADGIASLITAVRATLAGVRTENPANSVSSLQSLHSSPVKQPWGQAESGARELESAMQTAGEMVSQVNGLLASPFGTPSSGFGPPLDAASADELSAHGENSELNLDALVSEALQTWGGGTELGGAQYGPAASGRPSTPDSGVSPGASPWRSSSPGPVQSAPGASTADRQPKAPADGIRTISMVHAAVGRRSPPRRKERRGDTTPKTISASPGVLSRQGDGHAATRDESQGGMTQRQTQVVSHMQFQMQQAETQPSFTPMQSQVTQRPESQASTISGSVHTQRGAEPEIRRARRTLSDRTQANDALTIEQTVPLESPTETEKEKEEKAEREPELQMLQPEPEPEQEKEAGLQPQLMKTWASAAQALAASPKPAKVSASSRETLAQRAQRLRAEREQKASETPALLAMQDAVALSRAAALKADPTRPARAKPGGSEDRVDQVLAAAMTMHTGSAPTSTETRAVESPTAIQTAATSTAVEFQSSEADREKTGDIHDNDLHAQIMALA